MSGTINECKQNLSLVYSNCERASDAQASVCEGSCCLCTCACGCLLLTVVLCASVQQLLLQLMLVAFQDRRPAPNRCFQLYLEQRRCHSRLIVPCALCHHRPEQWTAWHPALYGRQDLRYRPSSAWREHAPHPVQRMLRGSATLRSQQQVSRCGHHDSRQACAIQPKRMRMAASPSAAEIKMPTCSGCIRCNANPAPMVRSMETALHCPSAVSGSVRECSARATRENSSPRGSVSSRADIVCCARRHRARSKMQQSSSRTQ